VKQRLTATVIVLVLGAMTTLVVAWAPTVGLGRRQALIRTATEWHSPEAAAIVTAELTHSDRRYPGWMRKLQPSVDLGPGKQQSRVLRAYGWPLPSMSCVEARGGDSDTRQWKSSIHAVNIRGKEFPLRPIWSGFALDTLFFAVVWTSAVSFLAMVRRSWRLGRATVDQRQLSEAETGRNIVE
jgi:hypothetical protein